MVGKFSQNLKDQKGQAIFELILFLPFLIFLYMIYSTAGDSISASINQQKAVRGYFYSLVRGNSYINSLQELDQLAASNVRMVGFSSLGWREREEAGRGSSGAFAPCFKFSSLLKSDSSEECDDKARGEDADGNGVTHFIRVFTFYGVCGPVYSATQAGGRDHYEIIPNAQADPMKCALGSSPLRSN